MIAKGVGTPQEYAFTAGSAGTPDLTLYDGDVTKRIQITSQTALTQGTWPTLGSNIRWNRFPY